MTIDDIEGMSDAEYAALSDEAKAEIAGLILESLQADGVAYQGADGRWRMREDCEIVDHIDGTVTVRAGGPH